MKEKNVKPNAVAWPKFKRPLIAILRGIKPQQAIDIAKTLIEEGFEIIEIPLNSPDPFSSIEKIANFASKKILVGAGTVLKVQDVDRLANAGGKLMLAPNIDPLVLQRANELGLIAVPGVFSATEALCAIQSGASALKIFPASVLGPSGIKAISAILPDNTTMVAVGGVSQVDFDAYNCVGVNTFGLGSSLYSPGISAAEARTKAAVVMATYDQVFGV